MFYANLITVNLNWLWQRQNDWFCSLFSRCLAEKNSNEFKVIKVGNLWRRAISIWNISISIKRSKSAVKNATKRCIGGSVKKRNGAKPKLSQSDQRQIVCMATLKKMSAKGIAHVLNKKVSLSTVMYVLNNCNITQWVKMNKKLLLLK